MHLIYIKAEVNGEPDAPSFTRFFQFADSSDEFVLQNTVSMVKEKLARNVKINVNEALLVYYQYVVDQMREKKRAGVIEKNAKSILSSSSVMTGVPETLRTIRFDAIVDGRREGITLDRPIPFTGYSMVTETKRKHK